MTPVDKLEKYFKSVLKDKELSEEEWAIPSEDLWESAKVHFPKKKKKKERLLFFWWGFGIACLLVVGSLAVVMLFQKANLPKEQLVTNNHFEKEVSPANRNADKAIKEINLEKTAASIDKNVDKAIKETNLEKTASSINNEVATKTTNKEEVINIPIKKLANKPSIKGQKQLNKNNPTALESIGVEHVKEDNESKIPPQNIETKPTNIAKPLNKQTAIKTVPVINKLVTPIAFLDIAKRPIELKNPLPILTTPVQPVRKEWEVGLSYSPFILIQESILNNGAESNFEDLTIGVQHQNINASIRRFIHPRFSVSSGLYLSKGSIDLAFCDTGIYGESTPISFRSFLGESDTFNEIKLTDSGIDLDASIEYLADANLNAGDELRIKGEIPFKIKFVQVPILFNAHFGKRKFKGQVHAGFSLDYQQVKANDIKLEVFKANELISKPIRDDSLNEQTVHLRWQAGFGWRYAVKDFLEVGSAVHINISEPILSRYDFGVYYGF